VADEIKELIEQQGKAFAEFKAANDAMQTEVKRLGSADVVLTEKVEKLNGALTTLSDAIETATKAEKLRAEQFDEMERKLGRLDTGKRGDDDTVIDVKSFQGHRMSRGLQGEVTEAEAVEYQKAFGRFLRKGEGFSDAERKAMSVGSDPDGGFLVTPDMSGRTVTRIFDTSDMRRFANSQTIGTDALEGSKDLNEASAGWVGESDTRSVTSTPQVGTWRIPTFEQYAMPDATQKMLDDANMDVEAWLAGKVADKFQRLENAAFVVGTGVNQPRGFATYSTAATADGSRTWGVFEHIATGTSGDFTSGVTQADCLFNIIHRTKPMYLQNGTWFMPRLLTADIRKMKDTTGQYLWQPSMQKGEPDMLLGYPLAKFEDMAAKAAGSLSIAFGDMRATYQIVDRAGIRVLRDPYTAKPFVRFYTTRRVGGDVIHFEALKFVKFAAS
jgi:HK97 family phage major capsid protein